jgi:low temperature requirement protein LtrA
MPSKTLSISENENMEDRPDLHWRSFFTRFGIAILSLLAGTLAHQFAETGAHFAIVVALAALSALVMIDMIAPRRRDDEFDRTISMQAGTFAGIATVIFLVLDQRHYRLNGDTIIAVLGLPGFYLMQWLIMSRSLRWDFSRGGAS